MTLADEKKGITVKIDADLHAEVREYIEQHGMTMAEFITLAVDNELHPKYQNKEEKNIKNFEIAAENGNDYAEYQLGKLYLYGREIDRDYHKAMEYLQSAADKGNPYAKQLLHSVKSNRHWSAAMGSFRLLHHLARMLQNQLEDERKEKLGGIDRKLKRKIDEKKQAHGLKQ